MVVTKSQIRWWESAKNLGFRGTVVSGVVVAALLWIFARVPAERWTLALWRFAVYPVRVALALLVALVGALLVVALRVIANATAPAQVN